MSTQIKFLIGAALVVVAGIFGYYLFTHQAQKTDTPVGQTFMDGEVITIPVRVLMLKSSEKSVNTTLTEAQIRKIFDGELGVNEHYWKQAGIRFEIESIVDATPGDVSNYAATINSGQQPLYQKVIRDLTPTSGLLADGYNVVIVHDFGKMGGGIYLNNHIAYVPEKSVKGDSDITRTFAFAHELAHTVSLIDLKAEPDPYNILAISNPNIYNPQDKTHLTAKQITAARAAASLGHPVNLNPETAN